MKEFIRLKVIKVKNECFVTISFFHNRFRFQDSVYNGCHDLTILSVNKSNIALITVKNVDYHCIIHEISKAEAINFLESSVLENFGFV